MSTEDNESLPFVSVVIPSFNSEETLGKCLTTVVNQGYPGERYEIILVDGGSTDRTLEIAKEFPVRIAYELKKGRGNAYNRGLNEAKGDLVAFLDSDAYALDSWLKIMVDELKEENGVAVVHCRLKAPQDCIFIQKCIDAVNFKGRGQANGVVYDKKVVIMEDGFNGRLGYLQEDMLEYKIRKRGYKTRLVNEVLVYHFPRKNLREYLKQNIEAGENEVLFYRLTRDKKIFFQILSRSLVVLAPLLFLFNLICGSLVMLISASVYTFYMSCKTHPDYRKPKYISLVPIITYISLIGSLIGYIKNLIHLT